MDARHKFAGFLLFSILLFSLAWTASPPPLVAQNVVVSQSIPDNAPQATVNLNVTVKGNGFKKGAIAKWLVTGSETDTGGVTVNSTTYVSTTELRANITIAPGAQTQKKFDIKVTLTSGRTGKGIELFSVLVNPPDPAIAYSGHLQNQYDLMVMNADGTNQRAVVSQKFTWNNNPDWSPDGTQLVFTREERGGSSGYFKVNADGTGLTLIASCRGADKPAWSPVPLGDGEYKIAFTSNTLPDGTDLMNDELFLINADGKTGLTRLTNTSGINEMSVDWSPNADRIAVHTFDGTVSDLVIYEVSCNPACSATRQGNVFQVQDSPLYGKDGGPFDWAKTQDKIVVTANSAWDRSLDLWIIDLAYPSQPIQLTDTPGIYEYEPVWSPDDSQILFMSNPYGGPVSLKVMNSDGAGATPIPSQPATVFGSPNWRRCCPTCATVCAP